MERSDGFEKYLRISNKEKSESRMYPRSFGLDSWVDGSEIYGGSTGGGIWVMIGQFPFGHFEFGKPVEHTRGNVLWQFYI